MNDDMVYARGLVAEHEDRCGGLDRAERTRLIRAVVAYRQGKPIPDGCRIDPALWVNGREKAPELTSRRGVYEIRTPLGVYVGRSVNLTSRWRSHRATLRRGIHTSPQLQQAHDAYGMDALVFVQVDTECTPDAEKRHALAQGKMLINAMPFDREALARRMRVITLRGLLDAELLAEMQRRGLTLGNPPCA